MPEHNGILRANSDAGGMFVPFNYIVTEAIHYGMKQPLAISLVPILNGAR